MGIFKDWHRQESRIQAVLGIAALLGLPGQAIAFVPRPKGLVTRCDLQKRRAGPESTIER